MELLKEVNDLNKIYTSAAQVNERYQEIFNHGYSNIPIKEKDMIIRTVIKYVDQGSIITGSNLLEAIDALYEVKKELGIEVVKNEQ